MKLYRKYTPAFTIVELTIVIVVIAILSALTVVAFNSIRSDATKTSLKSDLEGASGVVVNDSLRDGEYAATIDDIEGGLTASPGNTFTYTAYNRGFCLQVSNSDASIPAHYFSSRTNKVQEGMCEGDVEVAAGTATQGTTDGPVSTATLAYPAVLTVGPDGNVYFGQVYGYMGIDDAVRKLTPGGSVVTLHNGSSFTGYGGLAFSPSGTLYASDFNARRIKTVSPTGVVTNYAGDGVASNDNGPIATASFNSPQDIAFDAQGNMYVADYGNYRLRKITPAGEVSTLAGSSWGYTDATGSAAQFKSLQGLAVDSNGNIFVVDIEERRIRKVTPEGVVTTFAGSGAYGSVDGVGTAAQFMLPNGMAIDDLDNLYVADQDANKIRKIAPDGTVTTIIGGGPGGSPLEGEALDVQLSSPRDVAVDREGNVYVADMGVNRIRKFINP